MALGMYFKTLRTESAPGKRQPPSQAWVAQQVSDYLDRIVHGSTISRIERTGETGPDILVALLDVLGGSDEDVRRLVSKGATPADGRRLAIERLMVVSPSDRLERARKAIQQQRQRAQRSLQHGTPAQP
jgi:hypothetical protein